MVKPKNFSREGKFGWGMGAVGRLILIGNFGGRSWWQLGRERECQGFWEGKERAGGGRDVKTRSREEGVGRG